MLWQFGRFARDSRAEQMEYGYNKMERGEGRGEEGREGRKRMGEKGGFGGGLEGGERNGSKERREEGF